jgi:hypothetical protein
MIDLDKIKNYTIEELIEYIDSKNLEKKVFFNAIKKNNLKPQQLDKLRFNINTSFKRINEPLELELKFFYFFIPFGIVNTFLASHDMDIKRFEKFKFLRKIKQYHFYSLIGSITYITIAIIIAITI